MATMTFRTAINMDTAVQWFALVQFSELTRLVIYDGFHSAAFHGYGLTYETVDNVVNVQTGVITSYRGYENARLVVEYDGLDISASLAIQLLHLDTMHTFFAYALSGNDTVAGSRKADLLRGFDGKDMMYGNVGPDKLFGGRGADVLFGERGRDTLQGEAGGDTLHGGQHDDWLIGGDGADRLIGGGGADRFVFYGAKESRPANRDTIADFRAGEGDTIDLSGIDARRDVEGDQAFVFIGGEAFSGRGQLRYDNGMLEADINGDGRADFAVRVVGDPVTETELIL